MANLRIDRQFCKINLINFEANLSRNSALGHARLEVNQILHPLKKISKLTETSASQISKLTETSPSQKKIWKLIENFKSLSKSKS